MEANGDDSIIPVVNNKDSQPDISANFAPGPLVCSTRCLASALDGAGVASLGLYRGDKGEVCLPQLLRLPQKQSESPGSVLAGT